MLTVKLQNRSVGRTPIRSLLYRGLIRIPRFRTWRFRVELPNGAGAFKFDYPLHTAVGRMLFKGGFEPDELLFFCQQMQPGRTVLDIGANGGLYSLAASRLVGERGIVHSFEPGERERKLLEHNISLNEAGNVRVHGVAISNNTGTARFAISRDGAMNSLASTEHPLQQIVEWEEVPTWRLEDFARDQRLQQVDFIKIDVEGAEKLVIEGGLDWLREVQLPTILFEAVELNAKSFDYRVKDLIEMVQSIGYELFYFGGGGKLQPIQDWQEEFGRAIYNFVARRPVL